MKSRNLNQNRTKQQLQKKFLEERSVPISLVNEEELKKVQETLRCLKHETKSIESQKQELMTDEIEERT